MSDIYYQIKQIKAEHFPQDLLMGPHAFEKSHSLSDFLRASRSRLRETRQKEMFGKGRALEDKFPFLSPIFYW